MRQTLDAFQVIADPSRRQMLHLLTKETYNISSLADNFEMSRPAVSKHIGILEAAGFITIKDVGRERFCTLSQDGFIELRKWLTHFDDFWNKKLSNLDTILKHK
ncbi:MAG: ArsR/SmtB family transcription factor [Sphingobacterium sp.]